MSNDKQVTDAEVTEIDRFLDSIGRGLTKETIRLILEKFAAGRVAASQPVSDIANGLGFVIDWLEGGKDLLLAAKELRSLVAASPQAPNKRVLNLPEPTEEMVKACLDAGFVLAASPAPVSQTDFEKLRDAALNVLHEFGTASNGLQDLYQLVKPSQAAEPAPPADAVTDDMVLAACRVRSPEIFRHGLQGLKTDGEKTAATLARESNEVRSMLNAALSDRKIAPPAETSQPVAQKADAVGEASAMPGTSGFTMACFKASDVPVGTKLYTTPQAPALTSAELQSYEMHIAQADEIREILDALAPETEGNLQTRVKKALTDAERLDAKRLDWLDQQGESYGFQNEHHGNRWVLDGPFRSARAAIDAAMAAKDAA